MDDGSRKGRGRKSVKAEHGPGERVESRKLANSCLNEPFERTKRKRKGDGAREGGPRRGGRTRRRGRKGRRERRGEGHRDGTTRNTAMAKEVEEGKSFDRKANGGKKEKLH